MQIRWPDDDADYIRTRSQRYPGAMDIEPDWTQEVLDDDRVIELSPYRLSRIRATAYIGWSESAGRVLVVLAFMDLSGNLRGINAWPASGIDLRTYEEGVSDGGQT